MNSVITKLDLDLVHTLNFIDRINNHIVLAKERGFETATLVFTGVKVPTTDFDNPLLIIENDGCVRTLSQTVFKMLVDGGFQANLEQKEVSWLESTAPQVDFKVGGAMSVPAVYHQPKTRTESVDIVTVLNIL